MENSRLIKVPFAGFYESIHDQNIDYAIEQIFSDDQGDCHIPEEFWLKFDCTNTHKAYAKFYVECFNEWLNENEVKISLKFESMKSPRFYNFETDRIFCNISNDDIAVLHSTVDHSRLHDVAKQRHTSYSGFMSSYDPDWTTWGEVSTWDHNQLETLLIAVIDWQSDDEMMGDISDALESIEELVNDHLGESCEKMASDFYKKTYQQG